MWNNFQYASFEFKKQLKYVQSKKCNLNWTITATYLKQRLFSRKYNEPNHLVSWGLSNKMYFKCKFTYLGVRNTYKIGKHILEWIKQEMC